MKKLLLSIALMVAAIAAQAQIKAFSTAVTLNAGVYESANKRDTTSKDQLTGEFYKDAKGKLWPVYKSANGRLYALRVSAKTGKEYKQYLTAAK